MSEHEGHVCQIDHCSKVTKTLMKTLKPYYMLKKKEAGSDPTKT
jgi:hypothetical protein